ncbi:MAG TPA: universal stress protein [Trebonia sp.]|jgi:nucleotide-binding universal stress UspA family protein|nr:universal stress protein [Trebonia sp.]
MTEQGAPTHSVLVWVGMRTWQACVDAATRLPPASTRITLIYVAATEPPDAAHGAYLGLMGRRPPGRDPGSLITEFSLASAAELLDAAALRLGRPCERIVRQGRPEREVVAAAADADLLIVARDGDQSRLGPKSLGKEARFVVDHAPCQVLLIWPGTAPSLASIPPKPPKPPHETKPQHKA